VWALRRTVLRPLARLTSVTDALAAGDLSARARLHGSDELARLGRHFDGMAEMLAGMLVTLEGERGFLQALLDAMPDPVLVIDASYRIVLANAAYRQLLGLSADFMGKSCHSVGRGLAEPCPATLVICPVRELASGKEALRSVITLQRADGLALDVEIDTAPLVAADGRRLVVEVLRPLGEKVRFSQEQRLSAIGLLANGVAHEIRNPLASIRIALQGAQRRLRGEELDRDALSSYLDLVDREIDRCVSITERLLRMSQPSAAIARPTAVVPAITETLALLAEEARVQNIKVETDIQPDNFAVLADDAELRMLTLNLAQNAFHAMPQGGCLSVTGRIQDDMGELVFRDSGRGIDVEDLPMIFMPFFSHRVDGRQGSGLGLAICKAMVERFGGSIHADSQTGRGSTFTVRLPLAKREHR
ncbi:MAG: histidine kinase, partial [Hydrogenophilales bacterium CG18_big_fil_WC_8_21_14_2_50_58_12]